MGRFLKKLVKWTLLVLGGFTALAIVLTIFFGEPLTEEERAIRDAERVVAQQERAAATEARATERAASSAARSALEAAEAEALAAEQLAAEQERAAAQEAVRAAELAAEAEERRSGFHCLSSWDGSHANFKRTVEATMRDPDSFEHIETRVTPVSESGEHIIQMSYRARNGFGGMNVGTAIGTYRNDNCDFTVVSVE